MRRECRNSTSEDTHVKKDKGCGWEYIAKDGYRKECKEGQLCPKCEVGLKDDKQ